MIRSRTGGSHPRTRRLPVDDGDRPALADPQAIRLRSEDAALLRQFELLQPPLQEVPRGEAAILVTAFWIRLIAAEKDMAPRDGMLMLSATSRWESTLRTG